MRGATEFEQYFSPLVRGGTANRSPGNKGRAENTRNNKRTKHESGYH